MRYALVVLLFAGCGSVELGAAAPDAAAAGDVEAAAHASPAAAAEAPPSCSGVPPWEKGGVYSLGDDVQGAGNVYQCKLTGWCGFDADYSPGVGSRWRDAWALVGPCS
jgi:chitinase